MEFELKAKAARKLNLLVNLANKLENMYGENWEYTLHPTCSIITVYIKLFKEINVLADEIEKLLK